jgi:hypothetical protein
MFPQPIIALWKVHPGDLLGEPIQFLTHGPVTHAGFILSDGVTVAEAYLPNVRMRPLLESEKPGILTFQLEGMTPELAEKFERYFKLACDPKFAAEYSVKGLIGFALNISPPDSFHLFCSEWVMQSIRKVAPELQPLTRCEDYQVSPRDLLISPRLIEVTN